MNIDEKDYYKIIDHLYLNQLDFDKSFFGDINDGDKVSLDKS